MNQVEIRLPELTGGTQAEQLRKIQNYLLTLAQQLQYAFDGVSQLESQGSAAATGAWQAETTEQTGQTGQNLAAVKSLILKSAQITEHFSQEISKRLSGQFVAQSQFGSFVRQTEQRITGSAQELRLEFSNMQKIETELEGLRDSLLEVNASIRTGMLYEDDQGYPVYGVEIGQQTQEDGVVCFRKFARLTAQRLAFFDANEVEVAYVSDRKLHVTWVDADAVETKSLSAQTFQMGEYTWQLGADGHLSLR